MIIILIGECECMLLSECTISGKCLLLMPFFIIIKSHTYTKGQEETSDDEAVDSRGIPGWDRVGELAKAFVGLSGLSVTTSQAREIKRLYNNLLEFDKKPLVFKPRACNTLKGRIEKTKRVGSYVNVDSMNR